MSPPVKPKIYYFPLRGRAEAAKLALAAKGVAFECEDVDYAAMKSDAKAYRFAQCPRYADADVDLCQSNAILRHIGRKYGMYGSTIGEAALIDELLDGIEDIRRKYVELIYVKELAEDAKAGYAKAHLDRGTAGELNGGAHFAYLQRCCAPGGWAVGAELSVGDLAMFDIVDLHERIFAAEMAEYPELLALKEKVAAVPGVAAYLASPLRLEKVNNNNLG